MCFVDEIARAFWVVVAVDEDPVLFGDLSLAVLAPLGAFGGGDEDGQKRDCGQDPPWESAAVAVGAGFGVGLCDLGGE